MKHAATHHIHTKGPPIHAQAQRLPPDCLHFAQHKFEHMITAVTGWTVVHTVATDRAAVHHVDCVFTTFNIFCL